MGLKKYLGLPKAHGPVIFSLFFVFLLGVFQANIFAVLMAEGGKEVTVSDALGDKPVKKEAAKSSGTISHATTAPQSRSSASSAATARNQQPNVPPARSNPMPPTGNNPPVPQPARQGASAAPASPSQNPSAQADQSKSRQFVGCVVAGTLQKDITLAECNTNGGRPIWAAGPVNGPSNQATQKT